MMMKWGRKETSSSSYSSRVPYLARVLPTAWLSRFKRTSINSEPKPAKEKQKGINSSVTRRSSKFAGTEERVYGEDFWRLSFGEHSADGKTSKRVPQPAWYDSDDELEFVQSSCQSCGSYAMKINEKEKTKISHIASSVRTPWILPDMKEFRRDTQILPDMNTYKGEKTTALKTPRSRTTALKTPRSRTTAGKDLKKANERAMEMEKLKRQSKSGKALHKSTKETTEKNDLEKETVKEFPIIERQHLKLTSDHQRKHQHLSTMNLRTSNLRTIQEDHAFPAQKQGENDVFSPEKLSSERGKGNENEKLKVKTERKSFYMNRELPRRRMKQNTKVRAFSPRTASRVEICKIKALEDLRKAKLKMKAAKQKAITMSGGTRLENFAVVKCSFDPEKDFRNSMIEMIMEKKIRRPEELEELLACYLTLNSETYHDLIIKVFQQVWFDLDQPNSDTDLHSEECFHN